MEEFKSVDSFDKRIISAIEYGKYKLRNIDIYEASIGLMFESNEDILSASFSKEQINKLLVAMSNHQMTGKTDFKMYDET